MTKNYWLKRNKIKKRLPQILADLAEAVELYGSVLICGQRVTSVTTDERGETVIDMEDAEDDMINWSIPD